MLVILFFVLFIGQLSTQFYKCCFVFPKWQIIFYLDKFRKKHIFLDVCTLVNSQIASVCTGLNQLMHLRTRLVCSEIIKKTSENVHDIFLQDFQRFMY